MAIKVATAYPTASFTVMTRRRPEAENQTDEIVQGQESGAVRGCRARFNADLPQEPLAGLRQERAEIKAKGVDTIAVTGVNDVFVMDAWKKASGGERHRVSRRRQRQLGQGARPDRGPDRARARRALAALCHGGRRRPWLKTLNVEDAPGKAEVSGADNLLKSM